MCLCLFVLKLNEGPSPSPSLGTHHWWLHYTQLPLSAILSCHYVHLLINLILTAWQNIIKFRFFTTAKESLKAFEFCLVSSLSGFKRCLRGCLLSQFFHSYLILISFSNLPPLQLLWPKSSPTSHYLQLSKKSPQKLPKQRFAGISRILIKDISNKNIKVFCSPTCQPYLPWWSI